MLPNLCSGITFPCIVQVKSLHMGPKYVCAQATIRVSALEVNTTAPESQTPLCVLFAIQFTHAYLEILLRKEQCTFLCLGVDGRLTKTRNDQWCTGAKAVLRTVCRSGLPVCPMLTEPEAISRAKT